MGTNDRTEKPKHTGELSSKWKNFLCNPQKAPGLVNLPYSLSGASEPSCSLLLSAKNDTKQAQRRAALCPQGRSQQPTSAPTVSLLKCLFMLFPACGTISHLPWNVHPGFQLPGVKPALSLWLMAPALPSSQFLPWPWSHASSMVTPGVLVCH